MPRKDFTDITFVLDRSGSMAAIRAATVEGFNGFVADQKKVPGDGCWTLARFDTPTLGEEFPQTVFAGRPQHEVPPLTAETFVPRGGTALVDALCMTIDRVGARLAALAEAERPDRVLIVVMTDGEENSSRRYTAHDLNARISHQRERYGWVFLFLGANQDAIATAAKYGIAKGNSMTYQATNAGTGAAFAVASAGTRAWKADGNGDAANLLTPAAPDVKVAVTVNANGDN